MYYLFLYSLLISVIIFTIIQYIDRSKQDLNNPNQDLMQTLLTKNNAILFFMLFLVSTVVLYYILYDDNDIFSLFGLLDVSPSDTSKKFQIKDSLYDVKKTVSIDPTMLKRINDPLKYGFEPYSDASDSSHHEASSSSSSASDISDSSDSD